MPKNASLRDNAFIATLGLIVVNVFWGASSIAAREALLQLNAIEIVTLRFTIALLIVLGLALLIKGRRALLIDKKDIPAFILMPLSNVSVGFILQVQALAYTFLFGVLELLPFYVLCTPMTPLASLNALSWSSILFLAVLCSVFAFLVYTHGLNRLKASDVAMSIYVTPLAGIMLAIALLGEPMTGYTIGGTALILAGMYLAQGEHTEKPGESAPPGNGWGE